VKRTLSRLTTKITAAATRMLQSSLSLGMLVTILVLGCLTMPGSPHRRLATVGDDCGAAACKASPLLNELKDLEGSDEKIKVKLYPEAADEITLPKTVKVKAETWKPKAYTCTISFTKKQLGLKIGQMEKAGVIVENSKVVVISTSNPKCVSQGIGKGSQLLSVDDLPVTSRSQVTNYLKKLTPTVKSPIKISFMCPYDREVADEVADQDVDMPTAIEMTGADESLNGWYILDITKYRYYHTDPKPRFSKVGPCHCNKFSSGKLMWAEPQPPSPLPASLSLQILPSAKHARIHVSLRRLTSTGPT